MAMTVTTNNPGDSNEVGRSADEFARFSGLDHASHDTLINLARDLGVPNCDEATSDKLRRRIRKRVAILRELDPNALADVLRWGRRTVPPDATKADLVREIQTIHRQDYETLSHPGLAVLAKLRGIQVDPADHAEAIIERLQDSGGFWSKLHRKRRRWIGSLLDRLVEAPTTEPPSAPDTAPGPQAPSATDVSAAQRRLRRQIETHGVVGGIANRLRGAADTYIEAKLDEIERRIDAKLEDIDRRLAEWRDREIANRLRILRITLAFTLVVALLSLGYNIAKRWAVDTEPGIEQVDTGE